MSDKPVPCHWCGAKASITIGRGLTWIMCDKCDASGPTFKGEGASEAIAAWNSLARVLPNGQRNTLCPDAARYDRGECGWPQCGCPDVKEQGA